MKAWQQQLAAGLAELNLTPPEDARQRFYRVVEELQRWNRAYNLTAIDQPDEIVSHHLLDSLSLLPWLPEDAQQVLDIGSGAGFPAIPLAIARPDLQVTALDAVAKKLRFIGHMGRTLALDNLNTCHERVEDHSPPHRPGVITARALASLPQLVEWTRRWLAEGATLLAMKGQRPDAEIAAMGVSGLNLAVHSLQVPGLPAERHLVIITDPEAVQSSCHSQ